MGHDHEHAKYLEKCLEWYLALAGINNQLLERASYVRLVLKHVVYPEKGYQVFKETETSTKKEATQLA